MDELKQKVKTLNAGLTIMMIFNILIMAMAFTNNDVKKFEEIDVERINIVEPDGTLKLALFSSSRLSHGKGIQRQGAGTMSGMLFFNQEGQVAGGLVYNGKKIEGGQDSDGSLTFDGHRQDQTVALQHNKSKTDSTSYYEDGLRINSRPDRSDVKEEYGFYKIKYPEKFGDNSPSKYSTDQIDSIEWVLSSKVKVAQTRLFLGTIRGDKGNGWFNESGITIKNNYGKNAIKIYVGDDDIRKFEVYDSLGKTVVYNLIPVSN